MVQLARLNKAVEGDIVKFQFLTGMVQRKYIVFGQSRKEIVSIPHRYGTTTEFIRSLILIILLFLRFSTVFIWKVTMPQSRIPFFTGSPKVVGYESAFYRNSPLLNSIYIQKLARRIPVHGDFPLIFTKIVSLWKKLPKRYQRPKILGIFPGSFSI